MANLLSQNVSNGDDVSSLMTLVFPAVLLECVCVCFCMHSSPRKGRNNHNPNASAYVCETKKVKEREREEEGFELLSMAQPNLDDVRT